jgi:hypothetical protein
MDDLIYILLLVAWVAYSIYNAKQKKKQKEMERKTVSEPRPTYEQSEPEKPQRSIFEELFGEGQFNELPELEEEEGSFVEEIPEIPHSYTPYKPESLEEIPAERYQTVSSLVSMPQFENSEFEMAAKTPTYGNNFDLRKAVIHATILERPYQ